MEMSSKRISTQLCLLRSKSSILRTSYSQKFDYVSTCFESVKIRLRLLRRAGLASPSSAYSKECGASGKSGIEPEDGR